MAYDDPKQFLTNSNNTRNHSPLKINDKPRVDSQVFGNPSIITVQKGKTVDIMPPYPC